MVEIASILTQQLKQYLECFILRIVFSLRSFTLRKQGNGNNIIIANRNFGWQSTVLLQLRPPGHHTRQPDTHIIPVL